MGSTIRLLTSLLRTISIIAILTILVLVGCQHGMTWDEARRKNTITALESYLISNPKTEHKEEALNCIKTLLFESALKPTTPAKRKQDFIAKYPGTKEASEVLRDLETMAIVEIEYPKKIIARGLPIKYYYDETHLPIIFYERNGISAYVRCTYLEIKNRKWSRYTHSPQIGEFSLPGNGSVKFNFIDKLPLDFTESENNVVAKFEILDKAGHIIIKRISIGLKR